MAQGWKKPTGAEALAALKSAKPMEEVYAENYAKALKTAIAKQSAAAKTADTGNAVKTLSDLYKQGDTNKPKTAQDMQKKKEDRLEAKNPVDPAKLKKDRAEKALADFDEKKEIDWTKADQRKAYDQERKRLEDAVSAAGAELAAQEDRRVYQSDMDEINAMSEEDRQQLRQYVESDDKTNNLLTNSNPLF